MPENSGAAVQTAQEEATILTPSEQAFLQAFAQEVMPFDFVEAVLYKKEYGQLYVRTVMSVFELDPMRAIIHAWCDARRDYDMLRVPMPDHLMVHPPRTVSDVVRDGFRIFAQR